METKSLVSQQSRIKKAIKSGCSLKVLIISSLAVATRRLLFFNCGTFCLCNPFSACSQPHCKQRDLNQRRIFKDLKLLFLVQIFRCLSGYPTFQSSGEARKGAHRFLISITEPVLLA